MEGKEGRDERGMTPATRICLGSRFWGDIALQAAETSRGDRKPKRPFRVRGVGWVWCNTVHDLSSMVTCCTT